MGLDQYWQVAAKETIHTHRKFNALQGFMQEEWYGTEEGNVEEEFNCRDLIITEEILDRLEAKIEADELEPTAGFFFGGTEKDEWYREDIKHLKEVVIPDIRERLKEKEEVSYSCWY